MSDVEDNNNAGDTAEKEDQDIPGEDIEDQVITTDDEQIDSVSVELNRRDGAEVGDRPEPPSHTIERSSSSLTIENVKALEEATEKADGEWSPTKFSSGRVSRQKQEPGSRSSTPQLPPVKTGRASVDVLSEASSLTKKEDENESSRAASQLPGSEPLPPIGQSLSGESDNFDSTTIRSVETESGVNGESSGSMKHSSSHPRIMQFKRELPPGYDFERETSNLSNVSAKSNKTTDSGSSKKTVTFSEHTERPTSKASSLSKTIASREIKKFHAADGKEMVAVSIGTETEWSWLDSVRLAGKIDELEAAKPNQEETIEKQEKKQRPPDGSGLIKKKRRKKLASMSSAVISDSEGESTVSGTTGVSGKSAKASSTPHTSKEKPDFFDLDPDGIPPLELSSESDSSDFEEAVKREGEDELSDLMPGVGPPTILQYQRESEQPQIECKEPDARQDDTPPEGGIWSGICEFCQQTIKPFPTLEMQQRYPPNQLFCCSEYQEFYELYCCEDYHQFADYTIKNGPEGNYPVDEKIDIAPHPPYGSKQARRAAKERAAQRMREREMARQRAAGANQANFYAFARQMKTINYAYSSQKCRDEGWTLRPPSPLFEEVTSPEVFEPEPLPPAFSVRDRKHERPLVQKFYENGKKFLTIFADGTGNVFYPTGNLAILISSVKRGQYTYVVLDDLPNSAAMLATFEPHGKGTCYYNNGIIRLNMTEYGGIFCDSNGAKKKKWNWRDLLTHVHAPPFQPICIALNKYIAVRVQSQEHIYLTINCDMRSARFNTGVKLKLVKPDNLPEPEVDEDELFIRDMRAYVQSVLDKVQNVMKFSKSPKLEQIQPPLHLAHQIQRNARLKQKSLQQKGKNKDSPIVSVN